MRVSMPDFISETIYLTGKWEPIITHYVEEVLKEGDIFIDVGANIGYYSLLASKFVGTKGAVIALEASPAIYDQLKDNISLNIVSKSRVRTINAAASNVRGELGLYVGPQENAGHSTTVEALAVKSGMRMEARVRSDCLEELVGKDSLLGARLIKIDVEGAERVVLEPYLSRLGEFSHDTEWLIELSAENCAGGQADVAAIFDAFTSNGYAVYRFPDWRDWKFRLSPYTGGISFKRLFSLPTGESSDVLMTRRRFE
jgi:FkbM family methyltransferase